MNKEEFENQLVNAALLALIRSGDINPRGKDRRALLRAAGRRLKKGKIEWRPIADHRSSLLQRAEILASDNAKELAVVLYATLIEHALNFVIDRKSGALRLTPSQVEVLLKDTQIRAKFIWMHLLCGRRVPKEEYDRACLVNSMRNEFVHYKWKEKDDKHDVRITGAVRAAELLTLYLKKLVQQHVDRGFKGFGERKPNQAVEPTPQSRGGSP